MHWLGFIIALILFLSYDALLSYVLFTHQREKLFNMIILNLQKIKIKMPASIPATSQQVTLQFHS